MSKIFMLFFLLCTLVSSGQEGRLLEGSVRDAVTGMPLEGATVSTRGRNVGTITNARGQYRITIANGRQVLTVSYVGYHTVEQEIAEGETKNLDFALSPDDRPGSVVVVAASLKPEKHSDAAAAIHVVPRKAFEKFAGSNPVELLARVPGIEYTRNGVDDITFNARGLHSAFNNRLVQIVDGRNSMTALSGNLPVMNRGTLIKDDIERLEVVLGPQSAIYGPNAHNAVINFITRHPRSAPGTSVSVSAGNQSQFSTRLRHAQVINQRWAFKLTGEHAVGREYEFYDSVYAGGTVYGPPVAIPDRVKDFDFKHLRGEAQLYYTIKPGSEIILSGGASEHSWLQVQTGGRNQMRGVTYSFVQAKFVNRNWFASIYNTWGSIGQSFGLSGYTRDYWNRTHSSLPSTDPVRGRLSPDSAETFAMRLGNRFKEESRRLNAELRYRYQFPGAGPFISLGANFQEERPNGYGINLVDSFNAIIIKQYGGAVQAEQKLPAGLRFVAAARLDHHQNFGTYFSPRFALVKSILEGNLRVSWSRAYSMPTILNQYAGINRIFFGNGGGVLYLPNGQVISKPDARVLTSPLEPEKISTWEAGYKGAIGRKLYLDINYHHGTSQNFVSPTRTVGGRVYEVNGIPVTHNPLFAGNVVNDTLKGASFSTYFNYGSVKAYGLDLSLRYDLNQKISITANYSWFGSDITKNDLKNDANKDGYVSLEEKSLNAPEHRGLLLLQLERIMNKPWHASLQARYVAQYDFYSGMQMGTEAGEGKRGIVFGGNDPVTGAPRNYIKNFDRGALGGFTTIDLSTGYDFTEAIRINLGVTNLLDTEQVEFVGSPSIGRLIMAEIRIRVK